jgi:hypothetical protein
MKIGKVVQIYEKDNPVSDIFGNFENSSLKGEFLVEFETYENKKYRVSYSRSEMLEIN